MQIHVVQSGQTLYGIARTYGISVADLSAANQINPIQTLVIGQALVIPITGMYYFVQPGDTLYKIGRRFGVNHLRLAQMNAINPIDPLQIGFRLYIPPAPKTPVESNAYVEAVNGRFTDAATSAVVEHAPLLTYLAPFSFEARPDGSLATFDVSPIKGASAGSGAVLMMAVTNLENGQFSDAVGEAILNDTSVQDVLLDHIIEAAGEYGFQDIHFDFEYLRPEDREPYNAFLKKAAQRLHAERLLISTALAPKTSASQTGQWYTAHDYRAHGEIVDFVVIMTYEWGYTYGPPMAVAPLHMVRRVAEYALTEIPADRIILGVPNYGYDWPLPYERGSTRARTLGNVEAVQLAVSKGALIEFDEEAQSPYFHYLQDGVRHEVWFEDVRSYEAKFRLVRELNLKGVGFWQMMQLFRAGLLLARDRFRILKF